MIPESPLRLARLDVADLVLVLGIAVVRGCRSMVGPRGQSNQRLYGRRRQIRVLFLERDVVLIGTRCRMLEIRGIASVGCTFVMPVPNPC